MGGGPRTFPGGLSKWQWWRQQKEKHKDRTSWHESALKQLDALRQRAEVLARRPELAQPWERLAPLPPSLPPPPVPPADDDAASHQQVSQSSALCDDTTPSKKQISLDKAALLQQNVRDYVDSFENDPLGVYPDICRQLHKKKQSKVK